MSENFAEMLEESIKQIHTGEVVDGTVIDVKKKTRLFLTSDIKADGIISRRRITHLNLVLI